MLPGSRSRKHWGVDEERLIESYFWPTEEVRGWEALLGRSEGEGNRVLEEPQRSDGGRRLPDVPDEMCVDGPMEYCSPARRVRAGSL